MTEVPERDWPELLPGWVWLVGAGPGDPGLLTLLARYALDAAEVVVYDALVDERILTFVPPGADLEYAGKRGGRPSAKQQDISLRLIALAREGKRVVRLKGGDPFVFGRGGDETLALAEAGIPFRIVPGITAGLAGLAYAGIPATYRGTNSSITLLTGHDMTGAVPEDFDWPTLARSSQVLVFYMAMRHLAEIARRLIDSGRDPAEPVALIGRATTPEQRVVETTLAEAARAAAAVEPPAIVVVGEVVRLRRTLDWFDPAEAARHA